MNTRIAPPTNTRSIYNQRYTQVRQTTVQLCRPLEPEDYVVQPMQDVSPPKWHLAHTTWFFETFLLQRYSVQYKSFHPQYAFLFNSYYNSLGTRIARDARGMLSRPTVTEVLAYRTAIDARLLDLIHTVGEAHWEEFSSLLELGLQHEQQHQELLLTDIKFILGCNPLHPVYQLPGKAPVTVAEPDGPEFVAVAGGEHWVGFSGESFAFDNELPAHIEFMEDFKLRRRLITNADYLAFIQAGGYQTATLWLSDGWAEVQAQGWEAPLYWEQQQGLWFEMTLGGLQPLLMQAPVTHVSYYEAEAFANWAGMRLPTEGEWETAARQNGAAAAGGNFLETGNYQPQPITKEQSIRQGPLQLLGDVWEWTASAYLPYPGYRRTPDALGEYNGKFMINQMVLRGGSCATPASHIRLSYRNFFQPAKRWQFTGIRLVGR